MPVAKESFHAWQNLAAAMYEKDRQNFDADSVGISGAKDREISDGATREFLLAEAALKECCTVSTKPGQFPQLG